MKRSTKPHGIYGKKLLDETHRASGVDVAYSIYVDSDGNGMVAHCPQFDVRTTSSDIHKIRRAMEALIEDKITFEWEPWLIVETTTFENEEAMFEGRTSTIKLKIEVTRIELALREGLKYQRQPSSAHVTPGWPEPHGRKSSCHYGGGTNGEDFCVQAVIRDTPETRAALEKLQAGVNNLSAQLTALLGQDSIERALGRLLTAPLQMPLLPESAAAAEDQ